MEKEIEKYLDDESCGEVTCPNCGRKLPLRKKDSTGWKTMDGFEANFMILIPAVVGLSFGVAYATGCMRSSLTCNIAVLIAVMLLPFILLMPYFLYKIVKHERQRRSEYGYEVWVVSCTCGNCFRIVRSTTMVAAEHCEDDIMDAEYEEE